MYLLHVLSCGNCFLSTVIEARWVEGEKVVSCVRRCRTQQLLTSKGQQPTSLGSLREGTDVNRAFGHD